MRRAAKVDANQAEIVKALRAAGCYVLVISQLKNCCDLMVARAGKWVAIEIKDGDKPKSARKLTPGEQTFIEQAGHRAPVVVVTNVTEAIQAIL
jgi:Holliday junction resolvase